MSIKYNQFGEVVSVNGITTGQYLGSPMQDATPKRAEDNEVYAIAKNSVGNSENVVEDEQPKGGKITPEQLPDGYPYETRGEVVHEYNPYLENSILKGFPDFKEGDTVDVKVDGINYSLVAFIDEEGAPPCVGDTMEKLWSGEGEYGFAIFSGGYDESGEHYDAGIMAPENKTISWIGAVYHAMSENLLPKLSKLYAGETLMDDVFVYGMDAMTGEIISPNHQGETARDIRCLKRNGRYVLELIKSPFTYTDHVLNIEQLPTSINQQVEFTESRDDVVAILDKGSSGSGHTHMRYRIKDDDSTLLMNFIIYYAGTHDGKKFWTGIALDPSMNVYGMTLVKNSSTQWNGVIKRIM